MNKSLKLRGFSIAFLLLIAVIFLSAAPDREDNSETKMKIPQQADNYEIRLSDMQVKLFKNGVAVKTYEIQPNLLPGEDILLLTDGIKVESVAEADLLAEDFDG